jgi:hypothetical protein
MVMKKTHFLIWLAAFLYYCWGMVQFGLIIDTDDWGILYSSRLLLDGHISGDPNKTVNILIGLLTVFFDEPWIFPVISSLFGAWTGLGVYRIIDSITGNRLMAFLGWAVILESPVLLWLVLSCNSISFMTCFLVWALHCFLSENYQKGSLMLSLASLARPEPMLIAVFISCFVIWKVRKRELLWKPGLVFIIILGIPPLWWMGFNGLAYGSWFYSLEKVHQGGQIINTTLNPGNFLFQFWAALEIHYMNMFAATFSLIGVVLLFVERKKLFFLYVFFIVSFFGLGLFVSLGFALIDRFLLPFHIYLVIFSTLFLNYILENLRDRSLRTGLVRYGSIVISLIFFMINLHPQGYLHIRKKISDHTSLDLDLPVAVELLKREVAEGKSLTVLAPSRRISFLSYYLYDERESISFVSFLSLYQEQSDLSRKGVDIVILAPNDLMPITKSASYNFDLLTSKGLVGQGLKIADSITVSPRTFILKMVSGHPE